MYEVHLRHLLSERVRITYELECSFHEYPSCCRDPPGWRARSPDYNTSPGRRLHCLSGSTISSGQAVPRCILRSRPYGSLHHLLIGVPYSTSPTSSFHPLFFFPSSPSLISIFSARPSQIVVFLSSFYRSHLSFFSKLPI